MTSETPGQILAKVGVEGSNPFARSKHYSSKFRVLSIAPAPSGPEASGFNEPNPANFQGDFPNGPRRDPGDLIRRMGSALYEIGEFAKLIALFLIVLSVALIMAPFSRDDDDEEEPEPFPEELVRAAGATKDKDEAWWQAIA